MVRFVKEIYGQARAFVPNLSYEEVGRLAEAFLDLEGEGEYKPRIGITLAFKWETIPARGLRVPR